MAPAKQPPAPTTLQAVQSGTFFPELEDEPLALSPDPDPSAIKVMSLYQTHACAYARRSAWHNTAAVLYFYLCWHERCRNLIKILYWILNMCPSRSLETRVLHTKLAAQSLIGSSSNDSFWCFEWQFLASAPSLSFSLYY